MHIAILLYGRINRYTFFHEHLINAIGKHTFDIFLSSDNPSQNDVDGFINLYKPISYNATPVTYTCDLTQYNLHREETNIDNMTRCFINLKRVYSLLEKHVEDTHTHYDIILSTRIDMLYMHTFDFIIPNTNTIYIPTGNDFLPGAISNAVAYGDMNSMKIYMNIYDIIDAIIDSEMCAVHPEAFTYANIVLNNLAIVRVNLPFLIEMWAKWEELKYFNIQGTNTKLLQIGSITGFSEIYFLSKNSTLSIQSFSNTLPQLYSTLQKKYADRYSFTIANTFLTLMYYILSYPSSRFDIVYIDEVDGCQIKEYLTMCRQVAHSDTVIIVNNVVNNSEYKREWNLKPTNAWKDAIADGILLETSHIDYTIGRGMAWGKYVFPSHTIT